VNRLYPVFVPSKSIVNVLTKIITEYFVDIKMKRKHTLIFLIFMIIVAVIFGTALNPTIRNAYLGPALGGVSGMFIHWLIILAVRENESLNKSDGTPNDFQGINPTHNQLNARYADGNPILNSR
jgi:hypothetical protein